MGQREPSLWESVCVYEYFTGKKFIETLEPIDEFEMVDGVLTVNEYHCREMIREAKDKDYEIRTKSYLGGVRFDPGHLEQHNKNGAYLWRWPCFEFVRRWRPPQMVEGSNL